MQTHSKGINHYKVACSPWEDETSSHPKQQQINVKFITFFNFMFSLQTK